MPQRTHTRPRKRPAKPRLQVERTDHGVSVALDDDLRPVIVEAKRSPRTAGSPVKSFSLAWDETEALGITADMRRSGPGMLSDQDRKETLYKAYLQSVWISACVDVIAKRITSGGYTIDYVGENDEPTDDELAQKKDLDTFLKHINDDEDFLALVRGHLTDLGIYGESYEEIVMKGGKPFELYKVDCATMNYTLDRHGRTIKYTQNMTHSTDTVTFEPEEVIRWWLPDPKAGKKALSPIERILGSVDSDVHMADWVRSFFRRGARPNFWIEFAGSKEEADRFVVWLRENYTGMANAHVPLILYDGAKLNEIGKGSVDIDFGKGRDLAKNEILAGYQVPPAIISQIESGNIGGGTGESQEKSFLHNACDPLRSLYFEKFNDRIVKQGFGITCWRVGTRYADFRSDTDIVKIYDTEIRNGSLNVNEVRGEMGKISVEGGDVNIFATSREIQPISRLESLDDEQSQQAQAQLELTQAQVQKMKEPPPPPPVHVVAPPADGQNLPTAPKPAQPPADNEQEKQERAALSRDIHRLIEALNARAREEEVQERAERLLTDLLLRYRQMAEPLQESQPALVSRVNEALSGVDEIKRIIQAQNVTPPKRTRTRRKKVIPVVEDAQQHTGMMLAFMLDPETAKQLALPGGEPVGDLHVTIAFMGDSADPALQRNPATDSGDYTDITHILKTMAAQEPVLHGNIGGIGRFAASADSDGKDPVIALVDVPGLVELRTKLVTTLQMNGFFVATNHGYTPHTTLMYVEKGAPMPAESVPALPLTFDTLCLAIGDDRTYFKLGNENEPDEQPETTSEQETIEPSEESSVEQPTGQNESESSGEDEPADLSEEDVSWANTLAGQLARWQHQAHGDVSTRCWRTFESTLIPVTLHEQIKRDIATCWTPGDIDAVFERAQRQDGPTSKDELQQHLHELFSAVVERGHKAIGKKND